MSNRISSAGSTQLPVQADSSVPALNPYLGLALATVAVSWSAILIDWSSAPPLAIATYRMAIAVALLLPALGYRRRAALAQLRLLSSGDRARMLGAGALLALHFGFWTASLRYTSVASSVLFVSIHPALVAAAVWPLLGERISRRAAIGIALTLAGSVAIAGEDLQLSGQALRGDGLAALGALVFAGYLLIGRSVRPRLDNIAYSTPVYAICAAALAALSLLSNQSLRAMGTRDLLICLGLAVVCTLGGHLLYNWTLRYLSAALVSVSFLGEPVIAALLAWPLLGQAVQAPTVAGGVVILSGIWLTVRS